MNEQELSDAISQFSAGANSSAGAAQALAQQLRDAAQEASRSSASEADAAARSSEAASKFSDTLFKMVTNPGAALFQQLFLKNLPQMTQAIWGAEKAFESLVPTVTTIGATLSEMFTTAGILGKNMALGSFNLGNIPAGVAKAAGILIDGMTKSLEFQLSSAQKVYDSFSAASSAGGEFAGSLTQFSRDAVEAEVPMSVLSKVITDNIAKIANFGTGISAGAGRVAALSRSIVDSNGAILSLYGNFSALSIAVADYMELQSSLGKDATQYNAANRRGLEEYLIRQKELSSITGKNNETLKQEEARRRTQLDYNLKLGRLGETAQQNVQEGLSLAGKLFGESGSKYAEEYFATGGKIFTKEAIAFAAQMPDVADSIGKMLDPTEIEKDRQSYRQGISGTLKDLGPALSSYAGSLESLAEINRAAQNNQITMMTDVAVALQKNKTLIDNYDALIKMLETRRADQPPAQQDPVTETYRMAYHEMLRRQTDIDQMVMKNMVNIPDLVTKVTNLQKELVALQFTSYEVYNNMFKGLASSSDLMGKTADMLGDVLGKIVVKLKEFLVNLQNISPNTSTSETTATTQAQPAQGVSNSTPAASPVPNSTVPGLAEGGLTSGPTLTGERGVEAVIPLAKGNIPLDIDFTPMITEMKHSSRLIAELVRTMDDSKDIQRQILNAAY